MTIAYLFDENFKFAGSYKCQYLEAEERYGLPQMATFTEPFAYDNALYDLFFNPNENVWETKPKKIQDSFYLKTDGSKFDEIEIIQIDNYTKIEPPILNAGDQISFNDEIGWIYVQKGQDTLAQELSNAISAKCLEVEKFYDEKRIFTIRNGVSLTVKADSNYADQVQNWVNKMKGDVRSGTFADLQNATYSYLIPATGNFLKIPSSVVLLVRDFIASRRAYCRANADYHIYRISNLATIQEIMDYNYQVDSTGTLVTDVPDFIL